MKSKTIAFKEFSLGDDKYKVELIDNNRSGWKGTICKIYVPSGLPFFSWKRVCVTEVAGIRVDLVSLMKEAVFRYLYEKKSNERMIKELNEAFQ